jgi:hypothetical protein
MSWRLPKGLACPLLRAEPTWLGSGPRPENDPLRKSVCQTRCDARRCPAVPGGVIAYSHQLSGWSMRRRQFITLLGSAAAAWPLAALAQLSVKRPVIAFLSVVERERNLRMLDAFLQGLQRFDLVEDFVYRTAEGHLDRLSSLAQEVVDLRPSVILATVTPAVVSVASLTKTVPIVCPFLADPGAPWPDRKHFASGRQCDRSFISLRGSRRQTTGACPSTRSRCS